MRIRTAELTGLALDWAIATTGCVTEEKNGLWFGSDARPYVAGHMALPYEPSTNWAQGGPLIDRHSPLFTLCQGMVRAEILLGVGLGETYLVAACRAIVASKLGEEVDVPAELGKGWRNKAPAEIVRRCSVMTEPEPVQVKTGERKCFDATCWNCNGTGLDPSNLICTMGGDIPF